MFLEKDIFGNLFHQDCSTASFAIFSSLLNLSMFRDFTTDLSDGQNIILSIHISVNFWTIISILSLLFGIAIIIVFSLSLFSSLLTFPIYQIKRHLSISFIFISYLFFGSLTS
jgi:hypothetical protein